MMRKLLTLTFIIFSFNAFAENSRSPAVLPGCNLPVSITYSIIVDGKIVMREKPVEQVQKEQCIEARNCMNSADEEDMKDLKDLEAAACNNIIRPVMTKVPGNVIDKNFDGKREAKVNQDQNPISLPAKNTALPK
jgi:hypothetical protein